MPSFCRFDAQPAEYRESVLPSSCMRRVSVEAGVTDLWWKYLGCQGEAVGINRFGFSAPGTQVLEELGMNVDNVVAAIHKVLAQINREYFPSSPFRGCSASAGTAPFSCLPGCQEKGKAVFTKHQYP